MSQLNFLEIITEESKKFKETSVKVRRRLWWQNVKMNIAISLILILLVVVMIVAAVLSKTLKKPNNKVGANDPVINDVNNIENASDKPRFKIDNKT